jgi:flagellar M-ring protein FliF
MNANFGQLVQQLQSIWKQLGLNQRVSLVLAALVVLAGLASLALWSSRGDYALLYGRLDDGEAAKVVAALDEAKITYKISRGGGAISVPADKVHVVRMQLAAKGIPRGEGVGFEIFDKPNFGLSDFVQRANYVRAVQGELARTIGQVDSIETARVMIVLPENRLLFDNQKKPTASVFVRVRGNGTLPSQTVEAIRFLVANSVEGLTAGNVSVVDNQGNVLSSNTENDSVAGLTSTQLSARKNLEQYLSKKAEGMLDKVLGPGQSVVRVAAEINFDSLSRTEEKFDPDGKVERMTTINDENVESTTPGGGNGGVPGVATDANTETNATPNTASAVLSNRTRKKVTNNQFEINRIINNLMQTPGGLKRLSAAVFVAAKITTTGTNRVVTPRPPDEMQKLRRVVQSALGIQENEATRRDEITVEEMPFNDQPAMELTRQFDTEQKRQFWWDLARNLAYPLLAVGVLWFFWRTFRRTSAADIPIGIPLGEFGEDGNGHSQGGNGNGNGNGIGRRKAPVPGVVTVDVLNQLIRENPNNMTQAIRGWMTRSKAK